VRAQLVPLLAGCTRSRASGDIIEFKLTRAFHSIYCTLLGPGLSTHSLCTHNAELRIAVKVHRNFTLLLSVTSVYRN